MMALVMSQLRPVLEGFNRSLEHLSRQVADLTHEVAQLRGSQLEAGPLDGPELDEAAAEEERLDDKLDEVFKQVGEVRRQVESQQADVERRLHYQHAMLQYNLTSLKADVDVKLKRQQKMQQVSRSAHLPLILPSNTENESKGLFLTPGQPAGHQQHPDGAEAGPAGKGSTPAALRLLGALGGRRAPGQHGGQQHGEGGSNTHSVRHFLSTVT